MTKRRLKEMSEWASVHQFNVDTMTTGFAKFIKEFPFGISALAKDNMILKDRIAPEIVIEISYFISMTRLSFLSDDVLCITFYLRDIGIGEQILLNKTSFKSVEDSEKFFKQLEDELHNGMKEIFELANGMAKIAGESLLISI